ncbi:DUF58 domain-containing protein [Sphingomonas sp. OK281]|uniref:DUF58 domain-containing protein n=1 Tax=Sphingomonas sp. OK281 TaxID=1881067 RepID=UPI0008F0F545|nr:DUF58 domain-containing protein [Sphingomonas sp. OK281]SFN86370.1 Uncharacterized conserved protein, DUF58 family, contains vWF domain [Sphingomonas sp. OK281]
MIYPTRMAVLAAAIGVPVTLLVAMLFPATWYAGLGWPLAVLTLVFADAVLGRAGTSAMLVLPRSAAVGVTLTVPITIEVDARRAVSAVQVALAPDPLLAFADAAPLDVALEAGRGTGTIVLTPLRRGTARLGTIWVRWAGPLGLTWRQARIDGDRKLPILPDIEAVRRQGAEMFQRHAVQGLLAQSDRGDGTDFDALVEFRSGVDRRAIDWKQSARHMKLYAKEYRTERNSQIVFAVDSGRQMSEPVGGIPRVDRAVSAALLTGWLALKLGDRVALHAFDSRPRIAGGFIGGASAFTELQHLAAGIDYSGDETNYTFALTTLAARLTRRSMIVLFTEFTDPISADFMVQAVARLRKTHLVLIVVLRDDELETIVDRAPERAADVTRAVTAAALLRDRRLVLLRLRRLGVHVIESPYDQVAERLVEGYIDLKRRSLL